jgi:hypothetical protein
MPTSNIPIMPFVIIVLLLLPFRLSQQPMKTLAFFLWLVGGLVLSIRGTLFLLDAPEHSNPLILILAVVLALAVGYGKGKFVLSKTSQRNIERIEQFTAPKRPIQVYSLRSWLIIAIMVGISIALTVMHVPQIWRGSINLAIGFALIISSLAYLKALFPARPSTAS